jgi:predicted dehydrogenase
MYHPRIERMRDILRDVGTAPLRLTATFSFPPLPANDFRYRSSLGGGAFLDLGPYAVSCGRVVFGTAATGWNCRSSPRDVRPDSVETGFAMLAGYAGSGTMIGHFSFETEYRNHLEVLGHGVYVGLDRVFTPPSDASLDIQIRRNNQHVTETVAPSDCFAEFFRSALLAIRSGSHQSFAEAMLNDARALADLVHAAQVG